MPPAAISVPDEADVEDGVSRSEAPAARRGGRRWTLWITSSIGLLLFAWLLSRVSLRELAGVLSRADPWMLTAAFACGLAATFFRCLRYRQFFFEADLRRSWPSLYGAFAAMRLLHLAMPLRTGELAALGLLKQHGLSPSIAETLPGWLLLRLSDAAALVLWLVTAWCLFATAPESWGSVRASSWILAAAVAGMAVLAWIAARYRLPPGDSWLHGRLDAFRRGWRRLRSWRQAARVLGLALLVAGAMIGVGTFAQLAFASPLSWPRCWLLSALVLGVSMLPIHGPLGLGTLEASWVALMGLYRVTTPEAVAIALGIRLLTLAIVLAEGALGWILLGLSASRSAPPSDG